MQMQATEQLERNNYLNKLFGDLDYMDQVLFC